MLQAACVHICGLEMMITCQLLGLSSVGQLLAALPPIGETVFPVDGVQRLQ